MGKADARTNFGYPNGMPSALAGPGCDDEEIEREEAEEREAREEGRHEEGHEESQRSSAPEGRPHARNS